MNKDISIKESQKIVDDWIKTVWVKYFSELTNLWQLTEEVWEVARIIIRQYWEQSSKKVWWKSRFMRWISGCIICSYMHC